ncbi:MAG TPA: NAD+ synthase [Acidimicrobiales bacterium]|nr:NAD+ synthase [Acidimicrobiales bacterium]
MPRVRVACCQLDMVVGDLDNNITKVLDAYAQAEEAGADIAVFGELALTGYPPEDLLLKPGFVRASHEALAKVAAQTGRCVAVVGFVEAGQDLYNAAAVCGHGTVFGTYHKRLLPNYGVFDEVRYFTPGTEPLQLYEIAGVRTGVTVCEDVWSPTGPMAAQAAGGAELVLNINGSPYYAGRRRERERMLATRAADASCALVYVNLVGGQDELVFDGGSMVFDEEGHLVAASPQFVEDLLIVDLDLRDVFRKRMVDPRGRVPASPLPLAHVSALSSEEHRDRRAGRIAPVPGLAEEVYEALVLGTRDYVRKNGFSDVVLGMSGGIDSSLVACIAADALGGDHVHGVALPTRFTSDQSNEDAAAVAANLGIELRTIPIEPAFEATLSMLEPSFAGLPAGVAEENLQGRLRMAVLMALNNKFGWLVLIAGNKSELAVGYTTIYGVDMAGGFAVIKDVFKTRVYELASYRNTLGSVIPQSVLEKPPSAELRPGQRDDQSLPPYDVLDPILAAYVEEDMTLEELLEGGWDRATVERIVRLVDVAEWKRRQSPPGVRVTVKAFGKDRRLPITNRFV